MRPRWLQTIVIVSICATAITGVANVLRFSLLGGLLMPAFLVMCIAMLALAAFPVWARHRRWMNAVGAIAGILLLIGAAAIIVSRNRSIQAQIHRLSSADSATRSAAAHELAALQAAAAVGPLIATLDDADPRVRMSAIYALGQIGDARAVEPLMGILVQQDRTSAEAAARALGSIGSPAVGPLMGLLGSATAETRRVAAYALSLTNDGRAAAWLNDALARGDMPVIAGAAEFFINQGAPGTEPQLIAALEAAGDEALAVTYLNCGNEQLENAAQRWAQARGLTVVSMPGGTSAHWGGR